MLVHSHPMVSLSLLFTQSEPRPGCNAASSHWQSLHLAASHSRTGPGEGMLWCSNLPPVRAPCVAHKAAGLTCAPAVTVLQEKHQ